MFNQSKELEQPIYQLYMYITRVSSGLHNNKDYQSLWSEFL